MTRKSNRITLEAVHTHTHTHTHTGSLKGLLKLNKKICKYKGTMFLYVIFELTKL